MELQLPFSESAIEEDRRVPVTEEGRPPSEAPQTPLIQTFGNLLSCADVGTRENIRPNTELR